MRVVGAGAIGSVVAETCDVTIVARGARLATSRCSRSKTQDVAGVVRELVRTAPNDTPVTQRA